MSDESSAVIQDEVRAGIEAHRAAYIQSGGTQGHIIDATGQGGLTIATHCLIRYAGRKSGKVYITPLCYGIVGGEIVIVASKGGADHHPAWYLNIRGSDTLDVQIATQAFRCKLREPQGDEREKVWSCMADNYPFYSDYQRSTDRQIPLIMLKPVEAIPVFREDDLG